MKEQRFDIYQHITDRIVAAIEAGAGEFRLPWHRSAGNILRPVNIASKKAYRGVTCWRYGPHPRRRASRPAHGGPIGSGERLARRSGRARRPLSSSSTRSLKSRASPMTATPRRPKQRASAQFPQRRPPARGFQGTASGGRFTACNGRKYGIRRTSPRHPADAALFYPLDLI